MMVKQVIRWEDNEGNIHETKTLAYQADAWQELLDALKFDGMSATEKDGAFFVLDNLYEHRDAVRRYFAATEQMMQEAMDPDA